MQYAADDDCLASLPIISLFEAFGIANKLAGNLSM
jgi:hypothetical protein